MCGNEKPDESRAQNADATEILAPSGHGGARQALTELRRVINPTWFRLRRKLGSPRHDISRHQHRLSHSQWLRDESADDLVANALTAVLVAACLCVRGVSAMLHMRLFFV